MPTSPDPAEVLSQAILDLGGAMEKMSKALHECRDAGMDQIQIRDAIMAKIPEESRDQFLAQWPMISMMLMAL